MVTCSTGRIELNRYFESLIKDLPNARKETGKRKFEKRTNTFIPRSVNALKGNSKHSAIRSEPKIYSHPSIQEFHGFRCNEAPTVKCSSRRPRRIPSCEIATRTAAVKPDRETDVLSIVVTFVLARVTRMIVERSPLSEREEPLPSMASTAEIFRDKRGGNADCPVRFLIKVPIMTFSHIATSCVTCQIAKQ